MAAAAAARAEAEAAAEARRLEAVDQSDRCSPCRRCEFSRLAAARCQASANSAGKKKEEEEEERRRERVHNQSRGAHCSIGPRKHKLGISHLATKQARCCS